MEVTVEWIGVDHTTSEDQRYITQQWDETVPSLQEGKEKRSCVNIKPRSTRTIKESFPNVHGLFQQRTTIKLHNESTTAQTVSSLNKEARRERKKIKCQKEKQRKKFLQKLHNQINQYPTKSLISHLDPNFLNFPEIVRSFPLIYKINSGFC